MVVDLSWSIFDWGVISHLCMNSLTINSSPPSAAYMPQWIRSALVRLWLVAYSAPSHYLKQCWFIVNWTLRNKLQWKFNQNTKLFIHENASQNIVYEMASILSLPQWVNGLTESRPHYTSLTQDNWNTSQELCTWFTLDCVWFTLGCVWFTLGCVWITLGCVWFTLVCVRFTLGCVRFTLGCVRLTLGCDWFPLGCVWFPLGCVWFPHGCVWFTLCLCLVPTWLCLVPTWLCSVHTWLCLVHTWLSLVMAQMSNMLFWNFIAGIWNQGSFCVCAQPMRDDITM